MADKHPHCLLPVLFSVVFVYLQAIPVISQGTTTFGVTDTSTNAVTVTQATTNAVTNAVTIAITDALTNAVTDVATNPVTEAVTNAATNAVTTPVSEAVTVTVTDAGTNPVTGAVTGAVTEAVTEAVTQTSITPDVVTDVVTDLVTELVNVTSFTDDSNTSNTTFEMDLSNTSSTMSPSATKKLYRLDQTRTVIIPIIIFTLLLFLLAVMIYIATYTRISRLKRSISSYRLTPAAKNTNSHVGYQNTAYEHGDIADDTDVECSMRDMRLDVTSTNGDTQVTNPEALKNPEGLEEELTPL